MGESHRCSLENFTWLAPRSQATAIASRRAFRPRRHTALPHGEALYSRAPSSGSPESSLFHFNNEKQRIDARSKEWR